MTIDVTERVQDLKSKVEAATRTRARKEAELDAARAAASEARTRLKAEFGVETPEQARDVLTELDSKLNGALESVEQLLRRAV